MDPEATIAVSASGKVLIAGGYLVVDRAHTGLVFGLDARIHVHVQTLPTSDGVSFSEIIVRSPQFRDAEWRYGYRLAEDDGGIEVTQLKGHSTSKQSRNRFVETALAYVLTYVSRHTSMVIGPASISIFADSGYYSQKGSAKEGGLGPANRFQDFHVALHQAHKTGLGSSAALVTAFTAAVLNHYIPSSRAELQTKAGKARLHNLAQAAHCTAQGKIGSGFDVAAAVYGSCIYRRFSPSILERIGEVGMSGFAERLKLVVDDNGESKIWDTQINESAVTVPRGLRLIMCDVDCGSETPGMVRKVFSWRKENPEEAALLWATLQKGNDDFATELQRLSKMCDVTNYQELRDIILTIRSLIREMSERAGVPIEPKVQTDLIDACSRVPGVVGGVVPGAGGFDAVALLIKDDDDSVRGLHQLLDDYHVDAVEGDGAGIGKVRLLGVKQEMEGVRVEKTSIYSDWLR